METTTTAPATPTVKLEAKFGDGLFSQMANELYHDLMRYGVSHNGAVRIAQAYMADFGRVCKSNTQIAAKVGKANKDGQLQLRFIASCKGVTATHALSTARVVILLNDFSKEQLTKPRAEIKAILNSNLMDYVEEQERE